ncbi:hypothetical protein BKA83DRAFT_4131308 [Pisolithus microcarpus]|nr:hypothetical protein BKA83DRAFT_4131308 [Pisolithus microcarpus]
MHLEKVDSDTEKLKNLLHLLHEPEEIITYQNQYNTYFKTWVKLGLYPTDEPVIKPDMLCSLFTYLIMMTMLGNWNTTKISLGKHDAAGQDINFGPALAEYINLVGVFLDDHLNIKDLRKQQACVNQFISLLAGSHCIALTAVRVGVAQLTGGDWEKHQKEHLQGLFEPIGDTKWLDAFTTFMKAYHSELAGTALTLAREKAMLFEVDHLVERKKSLQIASIWDLGQSVLDLFVWYKGTERQPTDGTDFPQSKYRPNRL